ncbi:MAG: SpoIIE family protein phosphatase [Bryobacterales bacterium]|nr:SpoIIE family protein phosphatase [Bryobacterales bacterium]
MLLRILLLLFAAGLAFGQAPAGARFHRGDDPRWADPAFDDSGWELVESRRLPRMDEFRTNRLWIRTTVVVPAGEPAVLVFRFCACEFYLNGKRVGSTGDLNAPRPDPGRLVQSIPLPSDTPPGPALLAIRHYVPPAFEIVGSAWRRSIPTLVPSRDVLRAYREVRFFMFEQVAGIMLLILVAAAAALAGLRFDLLSMLICAYLGTAAFNTYVYTDWSDVSWFVGSWLGAVTVLPQALIVTVVASMLAGVRIRAWWLGPYVGLALVVRTWYLVESLRDTPTAWVPLLVVGYLLLAVLGTVIDLALLCVGWRRPGTPRALLVVAVLIQVFYFLGRFGSGFGTIAVGIPMFGSIMLWDSISKLLFGVLAGAFVIRRSRERRTEELRMKGELQAARSVQSMLLGQSLPPGVDAVYVPASEVGGDFYYAAATPEGTLVLVGDVSGKGLQAAMTVSTIVGALRTVDVREPSQVLSKLNRTLSGSAGFVTCCAVLVRDADVQVANAGHPAPHFDGVECQCESGLPLGVSAEASWEVSTHPRPSVLTLISDGVVEATNTNGELFGFERTLAISRKPAKEIALAAQAWGQEDDITVVTVR